MIKLITIAIALGLLMLGLFLHSKPKYPDVVKEAQELVIGKR